MPHCVHSYTHAPSSRWHPCIVNEHLEAIVHRNIIYDWWRTENDDLRAYSCALISAATLWFSDWVQRCRLLWLSLKGPRLAEGTRDGNPMRQIWNWKTPFMWDVVVVGCERIGCGKLAWYTSMNGQIWKTILFTFWLTRNIPWEQHERGRNIKYVCNAALRAYIHTYTF